jgi:hypothetical protein
VASLEFVLLDVVNCRAKLGIDGVSAAVMELITSEMNRDFTATSAPLIVMEIFGVDESA